MERTGRLWARRDLLLLGGGSVAAGFYLDLLPASNRAGLALLNRRLAKDAAARAHSLEQESEAKQKFLIAQRELVDSAWRIKRDVSAGSVLGLATLGGVAYKMCREAIGDA